MLSDQQEKSLKRQVDQVEYIEIKAAQEDGLSSKEVAKEQYISFVEVNKIFVSETYDEYIKNRNLDKPPKVGNTNVIMKEKTEEQKMEMIAPASSGYYKSLVAKKQEENTSLKEMRGWLMEQNSYLKKSVAFLEAREAELKKAIIQMERQIIAGVNLIQTLEETDNFRNISSKVEIKNK